MPAAIAIPAIIGAATAGTQLVGAKMASNASKNAAKTQVAAGDKALAAQQQGYQQQRQDFSPYQAAGNAALGRLGQTAGTYTGGLPPQGPPPMAPGGLGQLGQPPTQMGGPNPMQGGQMVRVKAPTGEIAMLNPQQAQQAVQKGAQILS